MDNRRCFGGHCLGHLDRLSDLERLLIVVKRSPTVFLGLLGKGPECKKYFLHSGPFCRFRSRLERGTRWHACWCELSRSTAMWRIVAAVQIRSGLPKALLEIRGSVLSWPVRSNSPRSRATNRWCSVLPPDVVSHPFTGHVIVRGFFEPGRVEHLKEAVCEWAREHPPVDLRVEAIECSRPHARSSLPVLSGPCRS